ncbi:uncharacterized protein FIBRA_08748 [Fibroporia radiculosa]|uniref:Uncharacterized protein n=1 Tax=Fibroporia radiculosa TaxID=599839 RepID=J4H5C1_9APHY|nr:uncharacterized protein FIBRA_08748 [Fibroporia radiculosa]CCM06479.1 predicted protein [Fibroporia radiculosa]
MKRMDKKQVYRLIKVLGKHTERFRAIRTVLLGLEQPIGNFGSFAVRIVQKLPRVELLQLWFCKWETEQLQPDTFLHVTLTSGLVTKLDLNGVAFPSAVVFGRLVRALARLSSLKCWRAMRVPCSALPLRVNVADLSYSDDVFDFFVSIGTHIRHLTCYGRELEKHPELLAVSAESLLSLDVKLLYKASLDLSPAVNLRVLSLAGDLESIAKAAISLSCGSLFNLVEITELRPDLSFFKRATLVSI